MPELPEVQTTVNGLNAALKGLRIIDVWTDYNSSFYKGKDTIQDPSYFKLLQKSVVGHQIVSVSRRAKNVLINLDNGSIILIHMKMTGHLLIGRFVRNAPEEKFAWSPAPDENRDLHDPFNRFIHFVITLSNDKHVALSDMRKFAKVALIAREDLENNRHLEHIGPDPLDKSFTFADFKERLYRKPDGRIKIVLMDQSVIAGIGNIYSDEALWSAGIHPEESVKNIPDALLKKLYASIQTILKKSIGLGGDSMSDYRNVDGQRGAFQKEHKAYHQTGERCSMMKNGRRCTGVITRKKIGGRSAHFCPVHQKLSKKL